MRKDDKREREKIMGYKIWKILYDEMQESPCGIGHLVKATGVTKMTILRYLSILTALGLVCKRRSPLDYRKNIYEMERISFLDFLEKIKDVI